MEPTKISTFSGSNIIFNHFCYIDMEEDGFFPHTHDVFEMIYLKKGDVTYTTEGKNYRVKSGEIILTRPGYRHNILFNRKDTYDRYAILFDEGLLPAPLPKAADVISFDDNSFIAEIFHKTDYYCAQLSKDALGRMLAHLTEEVLCNVLLNLTSTPEDTALYTANPIVRKAVAYIRQHLDCDVAQLCAQLHITDSYLHRLFVRHLGISTKRYILSKRMQKARSLIRAGKKPTEIFTACGFTEYCTFFRNYKHYFGYPPSEEPTKALIREIET